MATTRCAAGVLTLLLATAAPVLGQEPAAAGRIKVASGSAFVVRDGQLIAAEAGQVLFQADGLRTGADGRLGVTLNDDTRVSLGPSSEMRLERWVYEPVNGNFALALEMVRGVAAYVSGRIAKLAPDSIRLHTPTAIVGVRGTTLAFHVTP